MLNYFMTILTTVPLCFTFLSTKPIFNVHFYQIPIQLDLSRNKT